MKKKTLIITVVTLIVLIAIGVTTYLILDKIEKDKINSFKEEVKLYVKNLEKLTTSEEPNLANKKIGEKVDLTEKIIELVEKTNLNPKSGNYLTSEDGKVTNACFIADFNKAVYKVDYSTKEIKLEKTENDCDGVSLEIASISKKNGSIAYFNPETGNKCSKEEYEANESASNTGNKVGCMKWYVILDKEGNDTVDLLLDHNTTAIIAWSSNGTNTSGPTIDKKILGQLKEDTATWDGVQDRIDSYSVNNTEGELYTIDYTDYKARLISAEEIAQISGYNDFNLSEQTDLFYFGTNKSDDKSLRNDYRWLFSTMGGCSTLCINPDGNYYHETNGVARSVIYGYWTSTASLSNNNTAWLVYNDGSIRTKNVKSNVSYGIRPVITVKKAKIY